LAGVQLDDALLEQQRAAYAVQGVDESEPAQAGKKRKKAEYINGEDVCSSPHSLSDPSPSVIYDTDLTRFPRNLAAASTLRNPNPPLNPANAKTPQST